MLNNTLKDESELTFGEIALGLLPGDIIWTCDTFRGEKTACTKSCPAGFMLSRTSSTKNCKCTKTCSWQGKVAECISVKDQNLSFNFRILF
jgi:hypothetical protein